jgi:hypothetical protein
MVPVKIATDEIVKAADIEELFTPAVLGKIVMRALRTAQCENSLGRWSVEAGALKTDG